MAGRADKARRQTPEVLEAVCDGLRAGLPLKRAAMSAGISERTFHLWRTAGWQEIEHPSKDSDGEMPFVVDFALKVEAALAAYIQPLVTRISQASQGKGKGDWRAAATLLQGRFPHEFSERVAVAKSQKVEVAGSIEHSHSYRRLEAMTDVELQGELESCHWSMRSDMLFGDELGQVIEYMQAKLSVMRDHHKHRTAYFPQRDEVAPSARAPSTSPPPVVIEHESAQVQVAAPQLAPDAAGAADVVAAAPAALPRPPRPMRVLNFNRFGAAINVDEDLSL